MKKKFKIFLYLVSVVFSSSIALYIGFDRGLIWFVYPSTEEFPIRGIDVSNHQGRIDWKKVSESSVRFAYLKATEGGDWVDRSFRINWEESKKTNLRIGAYHFFTLCRSGKEQAENFLRVVPNSSDSLPPVADLEFVGNCKERPPIQDVKREIREFLIILEKHYGKKPILYLTYEFIDLYLGEGFSEYPVWIRDIFGYPKVSSDRKWILWQYHSRSRLDGIEGPVDLNVWKGDKKSLDSL